MRSRNAQIRIAPAIIAIGTLTQKIIGQIQCVAMNAPTIGPSRAAPTKTLETMPCIRARSSPWKMSPISVRPDRHNRAGAEALQHAEQHQRQHAPGKTAQDRAEEKQADADQKDRLAAVKIGEPAIDRDGHDLGQKIGGEHPAEQIEAAERRHDGRHGGRDDGALDRGDEDRSERRDEDQHAVLRAGTCGSLNSPFFRNFNRHANPRRLRVREA